MDEKVSMVDVLKKCKKVIYFVPVTIILYFISTLSTPPSWSNIIFKTVIIFNILHFHDVLLHPFEKISFMERVGAIYFTSWFLVILLELL